MLFRSRLIVNAATTASTVLLGANAAGQLTVGQVALQDTFAALAGSSTQTFDVATATTGTEAVPLAQAQADFAALAGSSSQSFDVGTAASSNQAMPLGQAQADFALSLQNNSPVDRLAAGDLINTVYTNNSGHLWVDTITGAAGSGASYLMVDGVQIGTIFENAGGTGGMGNATTPPGGTLEIQGNTPSAWFRQTI